MKKAIDRRTVLKTSLVIGASAIAGRAKAAESCSHSISVASGPSTARARSGDPGYRSGRAVLPATSRHTRT